MKNALLIVLAFIIGFLICYFFFCNKPQSHHQDSKGFTVPVSNLQQFMNDTLTDNRIKYEGGSLSKSSLQEMMNSVQGDIVRMLIAADTTEGKFNLDFWMTGNGGGFIGYRLNSANSSAGRDTSSPVKMLMKTNPICWPCPGMNCCPVNALGVTIDRSGVNY